ncbi:hypothetical protein NYQ83_14270 [Afifella sp. JA880]|uniref:hypothetical protein n=1 Tax=Afifella sp. JA880 TaxID=2975280 RepID=UPI0021BAFA00|nr:hypothetical protein [Afifella sp. JA880]MCT8268443.1 hypothetical protein [Afifella sp. JA880]
MSEDREARRSREAREALERVHRDSEAVGTSSFARAAGRAKDHLAGADAPANDRVEVWGRRVGRGLSIVFVMWLLWYLVSTYLTR